MIRPVHRAEVTCFIAAHFIKELREKCAGVTYSEVMYYKKQECVKMKKSFVALKGVLAVSLLLSCTTVQRPEPDNPVYRYLKHSELQCEGSEQKSNVKRALVDIVTLPGHELQRMKYSDFRGGQNRWDLPTLLYKHFVPDNRQRTLGDNFYSDVKDEDVQELVKKIIRKL